jgi:ankyrin repeat protein
VAATEPAALDLVRAIAAHDADEVGRMLRASPGLASAPVDLGATRQDASTYWLDGIDHYVYAGDTALHIAAAAYDADLARTLLAMGADVDARNRRGAQPLHYAADGHANSGRWRPAAQAEVVAALVAAGADPNATDNSGVAPLHRAVRTRSSPAVRALLEGGADPRLANRSGSTPMKLAILTTGAGGSGSPEAKAQQVEIVALLEQHGATP